jgi:hypothetical protein
MSHEAPRTSRFRLRSAGQPRAMTTEFGNQTARERMSWPTATAIVKTVATYHENRFQLPHQDPPSRDYVDADGHPIIIPFGALKQKSKDILLTM